jgi:hypothetical protein
MKSAAVSGRGDAVLIGPRLAEQLLHLRHDERCLLGRLGGAALVLGSQPPQAGLARSRLASTGRVAVQLAAVHHLGDEAAHVGMHPPRRLQQHATVRWHRQGVAQQMLERARTGAARVAGLRHLRQLLRIAEQDHVGRRDRRRQRVGEAELARLVDHQHVDRVVTHRPDSRTATSCRRSR